MEFFNSAIEVLQTLVVALGAVLVVPAYLYSYFIYKSSGED